MPSKRNFTDPDPSQAASTQRPSDLAPEPRPQQARPGPAPRPSRGASVIPAPRKAEQGLHRVAFATRPLPSRDQIAARAYELWQQSGCTPGRDSENWAQAERELSTGCGGQEISAQQG